MKYEYRSKNNGEDYRTFYWQKPQMIYYEKVLTFYTKKPAQARYFLSTEIVDIFVDKRKTNRQTP